MMSCSRNILNTNFIVEPCSSDIIYDETEHFYHNNLYASVIFFQSPISCNSWKYVDIKISSIFSMFFSDFFPLKGYRLLQHNESIPLWNTGLVSSNFNGNFDFPPFCETSNITRKTEFTIFQLKHFVQCIRWDYSVHSINVFCPFSH